MTINYSVEMMRALLKLSLEPQSRFNLQIGTGTLEALARRGLVFGNNRRGWVLTEAGVKAQQECMGAMQKRP